MANVKTPLGFDAATYPLEGGGSATFFVPSNLSDEEKRADADRQYDDFVVSQSTAPKKKSIYEQAQPPSVGATLGAGLSKGIGDIGAGIKQLWYQNQILPTDQQSGVKANANLELLAQQQAKREQQAAPFKEARPFTFGLGETAPELLIPTRLNPLGLAVGAVEALKYAPEQGQRIVRGSTSALTSKIGDVVGAKAGGYFNPEISPTQVTSMRDAEKLGITPRLSEAMGSRELSRLEDVVSQAPLGGAINQRQIRNQLQYNKAAAKSIGEDSQYLTDDVLSNAQARIGQVYDAVGQTPVPIQFNKKVIDAADKVIGVQKSAAKMKMAEAQDPNLLAMATAWKDMAQRGTPFTGEEYKMVRENLSNLAWSAEGSSKVYYRNMLNALDDAAEQSFKNAGQEDLAAALAGARKQYANLKTIEKGNVVSGGNIDISKLRSALQQGKESAFKEGNLTGELNTLAKYSENFKPIREGSQTASRGFYERLLKEPIIGTTLATLNAIPAGLLASPVTSFIPRKMAGTMFGKFVEPVVARTGREAALQANEDLGWKRFFKKPEGL